MRYFVGFVLVLALGTLRVVGCGDEGPECLQHEDCYDQDACTEDECVNRVCEFRAMTCDDASECTVNSCDPDVGCQYTAVDDGIACDEINECTDGQCVGGECDAEPLFDGTPCDESNECTDGVCESGVCELTLLADGTACGQQGAGICQAGACAGPFPCTESGIREAIAAGGGPLRFTCDGPTTIQTSREIFISKNVILDAEGNLTLDGGGDHRVLNVQAEVTLDGITVTRGYIGNGNGGGIANGGTLTLLNSTVSNSVASLTSRSLDRGYGGGIHNTGTLTLINSTVSGNTARGTWQPTAWCFIDCPDRLVGGDGGAIDNRGMLFLSNSTVSENHAESSGGGIYNQEGGGISNEGTLTMTMTNCTLSGNVSDEQQGSAVFTVRWPIASRVSATSTPTVATVASRTIMLSSTLIDGDCLGPLTSNGYNIESRGNTCRFDHGTDLVNITEGQLDLEPLADNGGPTMTHALGAGSVAIDHIPAVDCGVTIDQRGEPRPVGDGCDVGSFERQPED